jgi:tagaturonate reductase
MILSRANLKNISRIEVPDDKIFDLPEKVLQFGTGVLLRCLPDYFIDNANKQGVFNGRVVVVKSTTQGDTKAFDEQDNLYTILVRGKRGGIAYEENILNSSISRVLTAQNEWAEILKCAHNPQLKIIISNTTENGIKFTNEKIVSGITPLSFPAKLLAFLVERYTYSQNPESGMIIIPTELLSDNGKKVFDIVVKLAAYNNMSESFIQWLINHNHFCNSLVDRIVPGHPDADFKASLQEQVGYDDALSAVAEPYSLWAIEGNDYVKSVLSFAQVNDEVKVESDITRYKELKLRILNGTHSLCCGLAFLAGFETVFQAMDNPKFYFFVRRLIADEIISVLPYDNTEQFAAIVLDRLSNPYIKHKWINITQNYTLKLRERTIPILLQYYRKHNKPPELFAVGFAAYILFTHPLHKTDDKYYGENMGLDYPINDERASIYFRMWKDNTIAFLGWEVLSNKDFWTEDLTLLPGFYEAVSKSAVELNSTGVKVLFE